MGIDLNGLFGGSGGAEHNDPGHHDLGHHDLEANDPHSSGLPLFDLDALSLSAHTFDYANHLGHHLDSHDHHDAAHHGGEAQESREYDTSPDWRSWHDISGSSETRLHMLHHSEAQDSNHDGVSDAASGDLGIDPFAPHSHETFHMDYVDREGHIHRPGGRDSDGDGFTDDVERAMGTDPYDASSHPSIVEAHHFPAGSDDNLPGTLDVMPSDNIWRMP
jgi:hypothetical protein